LVSEHSWTTIIVFIGVFSREGIRLFNLQNCHLAVVYGAFANFSEAIAEGRGKAQAESLRKNRTQTVARKNGW